MEMTLKNGFMELSDNEATEIDGGIPAALAAVGAAVVKGCTVVGTFCGATTAAPVVGAVVIVGTVAAVGAGIYLGTKN